MTEPVSLADIKAHLRLPDDETGEDAYLSALIVAARRGIETIINRAITDPDFVDDDRAVVGQAVRLIVGSWYANREAVVTGTIVSETPVAASWLLKPLRRIPTP